MAAILGQKAPWFHFHSALTGRILRALALTLLLSTAKCPEQFAEKLLKAAKI
jgi:hypothetical protein